MYLGMHNRKVWYSEKKSTFKDLAGAACIYVITKLNYIYFMMFRMLILIE